MKKRELILEMFGKEKPIIGMVHLLPLSGSPNYGGDDESVKNRAVEDALAFERAGLSGILVENYGDAPYTKEKVKPHVVAQMTDILKEIKKEVEIAVGVNVLRNDGFAALAIAKVTECEFVRINVFTGVAATDQGLIEGKAAEIVKYKKEIGCEAKIFADVDVKHATQLYKRDVLTAAKEAVYRGGADGVILTGKATGEEINLEELKMLWTKVDFPVLAGSGITKENIANYYPYCDGMIIGSYFKNEKNPLSTIDYQKVRLLFEELKKIRRDF
ncbi:MAG TPA: BtpA/SgcQ family protein [Thermoplasmata archaeon]|nr:BtpA/SgcQ family protein [Thermoplasmata archaeon]